MNSLPNELILTIFDNLSIPDKRVFIRTCKTYYNITKQSMSKIKYVICKSNYDRDGFICHDYWCICDTLIDFRRCLVEYLNTQGIKKEYVIIKRTNNKMRGVIKKHEFIIEETIVNNFRQN